MKSAIIYYSYSGNTKKVVEVLGQHLALKGEVAYYELEASDETNNFFGQCRRAISHQKARLAPVNFDLSGFDIICFGTPVWAFGPAPAMNAYLAECAGVTGKQAVLFTTYGSGTGNNRCLDYMQKALTCKGASSFSRFSVQQFKVKDKDSIVSEIKKIPCLIFG